MKRNIIEIDQNKCNGCGLCVSACHEGAIGLVDGKARLLRDDYCDGLGACLPECPTGAIKMVEREAAAFDEAAVAARGHAGPVPHAAAPEHGAEPGPLPCGCPGTMQRTLQPKAAPPAEKPAACGCAGGEAASQLGNWPVQLRLMNPSAPYLKGAHLLVAADCTAFALGRFHSEFLQGRVLVIGCPKLDDNNENTQRLAEILRHNDLASITVLRMEVPCCGGITAAARNAMLAAGKIVPYREVTVGIDGSIKE